MRDIGKALKLADTLGPKLRNYTARFWSMAQWSNNGCLEWQRATHEFGYGVFGVGKQIFKAHRIAYWLAYGPFDQTKFVLHRCDNPPCVNPKHLYLGSIKDNIHDAISRGRFVNPPRMVGESNWGAKLTIAQVRKIRKLWAKGEMTQPEIGKLFGVHRKTVGHIVTGQNWRGLA